MKKPSKSPLGIIKIALLIPAVLITLGLTTGMTPQQKTVKGKVIFADTGKPATGASIVIRHGTVGTVVDIDGTFALNVDGNPELVISFVGYGTLIVKASEIGKKPLKLELTDYKLDLESAALEVSKKPSGAVTLKMKDGSDAQPVFVLDGKVVKNIEGIDPETIESVNVIKDSSDPLMKKYNAQDGVILITTKKEAAKKKDREDFFWVVDDMPTFNGGDPAQEFRKYIANNLRYPKIAAENGIDGRVIVQFTVNESGKVKDAVAVRSVDPALDKEALRVVMSSPEWKPGKQDGKTVKVLFTFPINFVLNDNKADDKEKSGPIVIKRKDGSDANPVYIVDGEAVDEVESINSELIDKMEVIKDQDHPLVKKYNATDGLIMITTKEAASNSNDEIFYIVEDMPKFPGGIPALRKYIYSNLEYPKKAKSQGIEGEVIVRFLVNEKGQVVNEEVLRSSYEGFEAPALKVISEMPDWTPGMQRGKPVKVGYSLSINFDSGKR